MLSDRYRQLLTACVDGELSSRQRRHVSRLLRRSPEARQLLQQLQQDAHTLRRLPRPPLPADLAGPVLRTIGERQLMTGQRRIAHGSAGVAWMGPLAAAAAVLLILGAASYVYFALSSAPKEKPELARKQEPTAPDPIRRLPRDSNLVRGEKTSKNSSEQPLPPTNRPIVSAPPAVVVKDEGKSKPTASDKPPAAPKEETALTDRMEMFQLDRAADTLPVVVKVADLDQEAARKKFLDELSKDGNLRIELPCKHGTKAFERVQSAARAVQLGLIVEKQAQERIKKKWRTNYVLYIENVTPEELTRLLRQIGAEDRKSAAGKPAEMQIDRLVLTRMTAGQRKELSTLLGIDPTTSVPTATGPLGTDPSKPLSDLTAQQVAQALAGQGSAARPEAGKPAAKPPERLALVLAYNPVRPAPGSEEIKRFLESRKPNRPGALRVLLVLRG